MSLPIPASSKLVGMGQQLAKDPGGNSRAGTGEGSEWMKADSDDAGGEATRNSQILSGKMFQENLDRLILHEISFSDLHKFEV